MYDILILDMNYAFTLLVLIDLVFLNLIGIIVEEGALYRAPLYPRVWHFLRSWFLVVSLLCDMVSKLKSNFVFLSATPVAVKKPSLTYV